MDNVLCGSTLAGILLISVDLTYKFNHEGIMPYPVLVYVVIWMRMPYRFIYLDAWPPV